MCIFFKGNANGVSTPYLGSKQQLISDRKMIDDSDGYRGSETANCITQGDEFIDDEMSLFKKNDDTLKTNRLSDYKSFKGPLEPTKENANIVRVFPLFKFFSFKFSARGF